MLRLALGLGLSAAFWWGVDSRLVARWTLHPIAPVARPKIVESERWGNPASCGECHKEQYRAWRDSGHGHAASSPLFRVAFQAEPYQLCLDCHAPAEQVTHVALQKGAVTCGACHARPGGIATVHSRGAAPHPLVVDRELGTASACATCHQFAFPLAPVVSQGTVAEAGATACTACHLAGHRFPGSRDAGLLRRALPVTARLVKGSTLEVAIGPVVAGHRVPTGDPGRSISLSWTALNAVGERLDWGRRQFGREFSSSMSNPNHVDINEKDNRFSPGETRRLIIPLGTSGRVVARVKLELALDRVPQRLATLANRAGGPSSVVIHQQELIAPLH
jgi:hypothetical protein